MKPRICRKCCYSICLPDEGWCCVVKGLDISPVPEKVIQNNKCYDKMSEIAWNKKYGKIDQLAKD